MKRIVPIIALCIALTACTNPTEETSVDKTSGTTSVNTEATTETTTTTTTATTTQEAEETTTDTSENTAAKSHESVLYDDNNVKITFKHDARSSSYISLYVEIENNSDYDLIIQTKDQSVNDYMMRFAFSSEVPAGKKTVDNIRIFDDELEKCGLSYTDIKKIEFKFKFLSLSFEQVFDDSEVITFTSHSD